MSRLEQSRARFALEKVESVVQDPQKDKYRTQLVKLPARLHTNGLGQTVAFYLSSGPSSVEANICSWLEAWLREASVYPPDLSLIACITGRDSESDIEVPGRYRQASSEARAVATWLKRFAEAFLKEPEDEGAEGEDQADERTPAVDPPSSEQPEPPR